MVHPAEEVVSSRTIIQPRYRFEPVLGCLRSALTLHFGSRQIKQPQGVYFHTTNYQILFVSTFHSQLKLFCIPQVRLYFFCSVRIMFWDMLPWIIMQ